MRAVVAHEDGAPDVLTIEQIQVRFFTDAWPLLALATYRSLLQRKRAQGNGQGDGQPVTDAVHRSAGQVRVATANAERR